MSVAGRGGQAPLVLVADDDSALRAEMRDVLERAGFRVEEAADGPDALDRVRRLGPDVVLLDADMPEMSGYTVCERVRAREKKRATPILIVTGGDDPDAVEHAYRIGATDFIRRPISWTVLAHRVRFVLRASEALNEIRGLVGAIPDRIFVLDEQCERHPALATERRGNASTAKQGAERAFDEYFPPATRDELAGKVQTTLRSGVPQVMEHAIGDDRVRLETRIVRRDRATALAIVRDVTARWAFEERIYDLAYYDRLTGLPNRQLFQLTLDVAIADAEKTGGRLAVLFVDLDRFKRINDTLGHSMGDMLLRSVAERLTQCTGADESLSRVKLARLGGDEFVILLDGIGCAANASDAADKLLRALSRPYTCQGKRLVVTPSIGITMYPEDAGDSESLLMNADAAMYRAKSAGRNTHSFYSDTMRIRSLHRLDIENELRDALGDDQFLLHYQPKVDLKSWSIAGLEALLRWRHPVRGWIPPGDFVPVAEECGLILELGAWVLREACAQVARWQNSLLQDIPVSVNISSEQVYNRDLLRVVRGALSRSGIEPQNLELEITESLLMRDTRRTVDTLEDLKSLGLSISIDDFGTGYSSLGYLKRFPIDILKIDSSFVKDLHVDSDDAAICAAVLAMARKLELKVVAEGVEIDEQLSFLRSHGCDLIQGYLFSRPLPAAAVLALAEEHARVRAPA